MYRQTAVAVILFSGLVGIVLWGRLPLAVSEEGPAAIRTELVRQHIRYLASDELGGRDSGEPGLEVAAQYIAGRFAAYGLVPAGDGDSYFQHFTVPAGAAFFQDRGVTVAFQSGAPAEWLPGRDVEPFGYDESGTVVDAPLVFAGYGITAEESGGGQLAYDDYAGVDAKGKIVILLRFVPRAGADEPPFGGKRGRHAPFTEKLQNARRHGAHGVIFVTPPGHEEENLYGLARRGAPRSSTLPAAIASREVVARLLRRVGTDLEDVTRTIDRELRPASFELPGARARFATARHHIRLRNVAGRLEGSDPALRAQTIVVGAHYDHIGRFGRQVQQRNLGQVHNGADDNASGTAGVLELARVLGAGVPPRRSVLFICFSGEEIGLLGSRHWVTSPRRFATIGFTKVLPSPSSGPNATSNPHGTDAGGSVQHTTASSVGGALLWEGGTLVTATGGFQNGLVEVTSTTGLSGWVDPESLRPLSTPAALHNVVAMVNLDMIGRARSDQAGSVLGVDTSDRFPAILDSVSDAVGWQPRRGRGGMMGGSDHFHFIRRRIPVLFFFTGMHREYNTPNDDVETLNLEGQIRILDFVHRVIVRLANDDERPQFKEQSLASLLGGGNRRPQLGIQIDPDYRGVGVRAARVVPETPASKGGLQPGDVILRLGETRVSSVPDLLGALDKRPQGEVEIRVARGGQGAQLTLKVAFPSRGGGFRVSFGSVPDYAYEKRGVRFEDIRPDSPAAKAGVKAGDILVGWNDEQVEDVEHWTRLLGKHEPGDEVRIDVLRGGERLRLKVTLAPR